MEGVNQIIELALGLRGTQWRLESVHLDKEARLVTIRLGFEKNAKFSHPETGEMLECEDTEERVWRHVNFFQYACEVKAPLPRVGGGGPQGPSKQAVEVPWARPGSGFTLFLEAMKMDLPACDFAAAADPVVRNGQQTYRHAANTLGLVREAHVRARTAPSHTREERLAIIRISESVDFGRTRDSATNSPHLKHWMDLAKSRLLNAVGAAFNGLRRGGAHGPWGSEPTAQASEQ